MSEDTNKIPPESDQIEYKKSWRSKECLETLCAFANTDGGILYIGITDKGVVIGVPNATELLEDLPTLIRSTLNVIPTVSLKKRCGKDTVEIQVNPVNPFSTDYKGDYYIRSGSTDQKLYSAGLKFPNVSVILAKVGIQVKPKNPNTIAIKNNEKKQFLSDRPNKPWDETVFSKVFISDLSEKAFNSFHERVRREAPASELLTAPRKDLFEKLNLTKKANLKRASILLFHSTPEEYVPGAFIRIEYFSKKTQISRRETSQVPTQVNLIKGDLFTQEEKALKLLLEAYLKPEKIYRVSESSSTAKYPVPEQILRTVFRMAVIFKDYRSLSPIQIMVFEDKIKFIIPFRKKDTLKAYPNFKRWGFFALKKSFVSKKSNKQSHNNIVPIVHYHHNHNLIEVFKKTGFNIDKGIQKVQKSCRDSKSGKPAFKFLKRDKLCIEFQNYESNLVNMDIDKKSKINNNIINKIIMLTGTLLKRLLKGPTITVTIMSILLFFGFILVKPSTIFSPTSVKPLIVEPKKDKTFDEIINLRKLLLRELFRTCIENYYDSVSFKECLKNMIDEIPNQ